MEYSNGYVAFVDILGFSKYVSEEQNAQIIDDLFEFVKKFQYLFNDTPHLNTKVAFFSDSLVLTTSREDGIEMLLLAIWIAESYLYKHTGLLFRGGITKGLYYHKKDIAFGPAVVSSYKLENQAKYSRILIGKDIIAEMDNPEFLITMDLDGEFCFNPYAIGILRNTPDVTQPKKADIFKSLKEERALLCDAIRANYHTSVSEKYLWRIVPFNKTCEMLPEICREYNFNCTDNEANEWKTLKIDINEFS